ncbi:MAG: Smr/MutS family protein [Lachnospiraceae bacterium]|nr:Smr/MutS family protein [Lachnospiraceae bacterium]
MDLRAIIELDLHGLSSEEARYRIEKAVKEAGSGVYRIRCIHGYHGGTRIKEMIRREFGYGLEPKIKSIQNGDNEGITELVLR